jgi:hypothetical protein
MKHIKVSQRIDVWFDHDIHEASLDGAPDASFEPYCVSLCTEDGEEIRCLSMHATRTAARVAGTYESVARKLPLYFVDSYGNATPQPQED